MKGRFNLNFLAQPTRSKVDIEYYRSYFEDYTPEKWSADVNGGAFSFICEDQKTYNCLIIHSPDHGILVHLDIWDKIYVDGWVTINNINYLGKEIDIGSDEIYFTGNFISPLDAWKIIESYLNNPLILPLSDKLINVNKINWPE